MDIVEDLRTTDRSSNPAFFQKAADEIERIRTAQAELAKYFTSGNCVPVERATILAKDFWRITGMTPNAKVSGGVDFPPSA